MWAWRGSFDGTRNYTECFESWLVRLLSSNLCFAGTRMTLDSFELAVGRPIIHVYRAVCDKEYAQWQATHIFEIVPGSVEGKWFAAERKHAVLWGKWFSEKTGVAHDKIIAAKMPESLYEQFLPKYELLDEI